MSSLYFNFVFNYYTIVKDQLVTQDYIKSIANLSLKQKNNIVKLKLISKKLNVSNAAVSDMVKKLVKDGLVMNHAYKGIELTTVGWQMGCQLIRHHRLWEVFLHQTLNVPWDEIHDEAEHLEHAASDSLINRIDEYLGFPKVDPHGNPIPTIDGQIFYNSDEFSLDSLNFGQTCELVRFESLDSSYLNYLSQNGFAIGASIKVIEQFDFDQSFLVEINGRPIQITNTVAQQIFVIQTNS